MGNYLLKKKNIHGHEYDLVKLKTLLEAGIILIISNSTPKEHLDIRESSGICGSNIKVYI